MGTKADRESVDLCYRVEVAGYRVVADSYGMKARDTVEKSVCFYPHEYRRLILEEGVLRCSDE